MLQRMPLATFFAVLGVAEAAFLLGLVAMLSWQEWVLVILVTTALAGGTVFTVLEMRRLGNEGRPLQAGVPGTEV